ncbi:MAG: hypothetical protein IJL02_05880 [Methanobrevibacter sp.]|nr:hypothetical protein [Methanobrevibacter sp.]
MMIIPASFASENNDSLLEDHTTDDSNLVSVSEDKGDFNDYYFDASVEVDGNGTAENPYKYLNSDRVLENSNIHLANGQYELDKTIYASSVNFIGSDVDKTVISYINRIGLNIGDCVSLQNITILNCPVVSYGNLTATNTIFLNSTGAAFHFGDHIGGAIYSTAGSALTVRNCTFKDNSAFWGGAIFMEYADLDVCDSIFIANSAYSYGGAIACDFSGSVKISRSKFYNSSSSMDAGGAIYVRSSEFIASDLEIVNSTAVFGGAITTLNTRVILDNVSCSDCHAELKGGAIFHMYGDFDLTDSIFVGNSAINGSALFIQSCDNVFVTGNGFYNNNASCAGAVYSFLNSLANDMQTDNDFAGNDAEINNDVCESDYISMDIGNGNYTMFKIDPVVVDTFPARYSLVDEGQVTSVKDQKNGGNCIAFTAMAVLESCIMKAFNITFDFSEENLKNLVALYSEYGFNLKDTNDGLFVHQVAGYFTSWLGPVNDEDDVYKATSTLSPLLNSILHIQNILFVQRDNHTDNDAMKEALMKYGAVGISICMDEAIYYNNDTFGYYCWDNKMASHAVTVIGWDDNYSKSNFINGDLIEGDGAWIVKNSWGPEWGDDGYFYLSYYDNTIREGSDFYYTFILNDTIRFDKNYQHEIVGFSDYMYNASSNVLYKNVFTSDGDEFLAAVSTYFKLASDWTVTVNVNGESKAFKSGTSDAGYYTINLDELVPLKDGDVFEVIFNVTRDGGAVIPIAETSVCNNVLFGPDMSYASWDGGENWVDLYDFTFIRPVDGYLFTSQIACIKAFTILNPIETVLSLNISRDFKNPVNITAAVVDEYGNPLNCGNVTFVLNGVDYVVNLTNGIAGMQYNFDKTVNDVIAVFNAVGYTTSYDWSTVVVDLNKNFTDCYFDASAAADGNGTADNPYKYLTCERIVEYSNIHLANGEYELDNLTGIAFVNFMGSDVGETVITYHGTGFEVFGCATIQNVTLFDCSIVNYGNLTANNAIFQNCTGFLYHDGNHVGGAIFSRTGSALIVSNCTFMGNHADYGGSIYSAGAVFDVCDCTFMGNHADCGGSIYSAGAVLDVFNCTFSDNYADYGGAIYNWGVDLAIYNCTFADNDAYYGGAIHAENGVSVVFNCTFTDNDATCGGAIYNSLGALDVFNCTFRRGSAYYGGAIYVENGTLYVCDSIFLANRAFSFGGAIASDFAETVIVYKSKFHDTFSVTDAAGAIYVRTSEFWGIDLEIVNSTATFGGAITTLNTNAVLNNISCLNSSARLYGGAIYHMKGNFYLANSTFSYNRAVNGSALYIDYCHNCYVSGNGFYYNDASCTGLIYSIFNDFSNDIEEDNDFVGNAAQTGDGLFEVPYINIDIGNGNYTMFKADPIVVDILPSRYSLVDEGQVTSVKNQLEEGNCWAFAAMAILESCILKATNSTYDLSENNLKNIMLFYSDYGWNYFENNIGANPRFVAGYLSSWLGPVNESDDVYKGKSTLSPLLNSILHIQNIIYLHHDNYTDNDAIKEALMKYGAVGISVCMGDSYYNEDTFSLYCWDSDVNSNHAVAIVGWDDNYSRSNFINGDLIEGDGAWIVRNSWGPEWGDGGYFYLSYYDEHILNLSWWEPIYTFILNDTIRFDKNYQYDIQGPGTFVPNPNPVYYSNTFTSSGDEFLAAVSTYFEDLTDWTVEIYVNDEFKTSKSGTSNPGYYTINLNEMVPLKEGDVFKVVFGIATGNITKTPVAYLKYYNYPFGGPGLSFIWDDVSCADLYDGGLVACIKAFTILNPIETVLSLDISRDFENPVNITAVVVDEYGNLLSCGNVTFTLDGVDYVVNITNGIASIQHSFDKTVNDVVAVFNAVGYTTSYDWGTAVVDLKKNFTDYYFDVSAEADGNGTADSPYKYLISERIVDYSNIHLANGEYELDNLTRIAFVNFMGSDVGETVITYHGTGFDVCGCATIQNVSLFNCSIVNAGNIIAYNVIFQNCTGFLFPDGNNFGGAILSITGSALTVSNCSFIGNHADFGGAIYIVSDVLEVYNCTFMDNTATCGGAIYNYDAVFDVCNCTFIDNAASEGGAIYSVAVFDVCNCTFIDNAASEGGAIYSVAVFDVCNCTFIDNAATNGGAIYNTGGVLDVCNCTFMDNSANNGGAIYNTGGVLDVFNCTFMDNAAREGGAIFNTGGDLDVFNCTFTDNNAGTFGGAIMCKDNSVLNICDCTFADNNADYGGAIVGYSNSVLNVFNCTFADNDADYGGAIYKIGADLVIYNCTFMDNYAKHGGAIHVENGASDVCDCTFADNNATYGGAIHSLADDLAIYNCTFADNNATCGGSIYVGNGASDVCDCTFRDDLAYYGGSIYVGNGAFLDVFSCTFRNDLAYYGGTVYVGNGAFLDVCDSIFRASGAFSYGGAIACDYADKVTISKSKFYDTYSITDAAGAIYVRTSEFEGSDLEIVNSTATFGGAITTLNTNAVLNNISCFNSSALMYGGAIYHMKGNFSLSNSTFSYNRAVNGSALYIDYSHNCYVSGNGFYYNNASGTGLIYSIFNDFSNDVDSDNDFVGNVAKTGDGLFEVPYINIDIGSGNYTMFKVDPIVVDILPSRYSLVDEGQVTRIKNQISDGNCWAFADMAALESCILKAANSTYDLSVNNMKNIIAFFSDYGWNDVDTNDGGNSRMALGYLLSWLGPVNESDDVYRDKSTLSLLLNSILHIQNAIFLHHDNYTDNDAIKEALMRYGAVSCAMYFDGCYYNEDTFGFYCWDQDTGCNHGVAIVGWDDNYSRSNFINGDLIDGDGAWIVKNSWGPDWGDDGYFYISYYDNSLLDGSLWFPFHTFILNDTIRFDKNYQYDIQGMSNCVQSYCPEAYYSNSFTSEGDEFLAAVSTYFEDLTDWTVEIYVNDEFKTSKSGTSNPGYYTINLDEMVPLKEGDVFKVVFCIATGNIISIPVAEFYNFNYPFGCPGLSFVWDDESYDDLYDFGAVACIKAYTILNPIGTVLSLNISTSLENPVNITAAVVDEYGNLLSCGNVTFTLDGVDYVVNVTNGIASIQHSFDKVLNNVTAVFDAVGYSSSSANGTAQIKKTKVDLDLEISQVLYDAVLDIVSLNKLNETLIIHINDKPYESRLINGKAKLELENLSNGIYNVTVTLPDDSIYESDLTDSFVVNVSKTEIIASDLTFTENEIGILNITLVDENANPLAGRLVNVCLDNYAFAVFSDANGSYAVPFFLDVGEYICTLEFGGDDNHLKSNATVKINVEKFIKTPTEILLNISDAEVGRDVNVSISVSGVTGNVTVIVDGNGTVVSLDENGAASYVIPAIVAGEHSVAVVYFGDDTHDSAYAAKQITAPISVSQFTNITVSGEGIITLSLVDGDGNPIGGANVTYSVNGNAAAAVTAGDGSILIPAASNSVVLISFEGNDNVLPVNATIILKDVAKLRANTTIIGDDYETYAIDYYAGERGGYFKVKLVDDAGKILANKSVKIGFNGKVYNTTTDSEGIAKLQINLAKAGTYTFAVAFLGDGDYNASFTVKSITVNLKKTSISASAKSYKASAKTKSYTVTLKTDKGSSIDGKTYMASGKTVKITVNGKTYSAKTDAKGQATFKLSLTKKGIYNVSVNFAGDSTYKSSKATTKITIN